MKILVLSDSHGNVENMKRVVELERPDRIFHLGDVARDAYALADAFPAIPLEVVCGNCDYASDAPKALITSVGGHRIMLTHGHLYHVKLGMGAAVQAAREAQVEVLLFGHTHDAVCTRCDALWVMNPGSISGFGYPGYGLILIEQEKLKCKLKEFTK